MDRKAILKRIDSVDRDISTWSDEYLDCYETAWNILKNLVVASRGESGLEAARSTIWLLKATAFRGKWDAKDLGEKESFSVVQEATWSAAMDILSCIY